MKAPPGGSWWWEGVWVQSKALRVNVKAFLPNPQDCSKILQLEPTGMT